LERLLLHTAKQLDAIADKAFAIVFFNYRSDATGKADYSRIYTVLELYQKKMDHKFDRNLTKLLVIHPSYSLKIALRFFAPFVNDSLPEKVKFAESMEEIDTLVLLTPTPTAL